jgi:hypothetical protein
VSAVAEAGIVVIATLVSMPEIDERRRDGAAGAREHLSAELDEAPLAVRLDEIDALR